MVRQLEANARAEPIDQKIRTSMRRSVQTMTCPHPDPIERRLTKHRFLRQSDHGLMTYKGSCFCGAVALRCDRRAVAADLSLLLVPQLAAAPVTRSASGKHRASEDHQGRRQFGRLSQDGCESPQVLQDLRRTPDVGPPAMGLIDVYAAKTRRTTHQPHFMSTYAESVLRIKDGLPR